MKTIVWKAVCCVMFASWMVSRAGAVSIPFTEDFASSNANWKDSASLNLGFVGSGGPDGGSYVYANQVFARQPVSMGLILFRGQDFFDSSNDAFLGNWITGSVGKLTAYVRQNTSQPLSFFARFATSNNFPGVDVELPTVVQPNTWTKLIFDISPTNPLLTPEGGPGTYEATFGSLGNVQIGVGDLSSFASDATSYTFDLDKVSIGAPEPASFVLLAIGVIGGGLLWRGRQG
ncbi:MAG TPA: PEP-CTERM sorting domain-containing protein [Lacipirellulaceae bacterium]|jgi:hypothetical protein